MSSKQATGAPKPIDDAKLRVALLETALDCIISIDQEGLVVEWNPAAERTFGYTREQAIGRNMSEFIVPPAFREAHMKGLRRCVSTNETRVVGQRIEITGMRADGTEFPIELAITRDELNGSGIFTAYLRDIGERRESERQLADARDKALEASRLKSQFLMTISHELRTPLNGILGMVSVLIDSGLDDTQRGYAKAIQESGNALHSIITDLLDFSDVEQGNVVLSPTKFDLHELVETTTADFAERAQDKGLDVACKIGDRVPQIVSGDSVRVSQVLGCLLDNSIKFTTSGEILVRVFLAGSDGNTHRLRLEVSDTGFGIPREQLAMLFQPFVQGDGSASRRHGGTGLGLSICHELLKLMGGDIQIESEPGVGTTVSCGIPFEAVDSPASEPPPTVPCRNVLVVDANESTGEFLKSYLTSWGIETDVVEDGALALSQLIKLGDCGTPAELVLIASRLTHEKGLDVARSIHDTARFSDLPLILLTNSSEACPLEEATRAGIGRLLPKPVSRSRLYDAIVDLVAIDATATLGQDTGQEALRDESTAARDGSGPMICLVVEDNRINQQVLTAMLENMGHVVHMAGNGDAAVEAFEPGFFDVVFMDVQMPNMDGYEATGRIRKIEAGKSHVPIIAVTANAMKGDREVCIEAGMDDYIPKPIDPNALRAAINRLSSHTGESSPLDAPAIGAEKGELPMGATLNLAVLEKLRGYQRQGQPDIVTRLIDLFLGQAPSHLEAIESALTACDAEGLARAAHALRGASSNLGAIKLTDIAAELEALGRADDLSHAAETVAALLAEFALVETDLTAQRMPLPTQTRA
jgi:PAS domain S-box-containing protein